MTATATDLLHTPFRQFHLDQGAKMVDFAGWEMPLLYNSILAEHKQVRASGGMFDVSHMGRVKFTGRDAGRFLDKVCTRAIQSMSPGQCRYSIICNEQGGCRDDVLVYCLDENDYLMVCNAANRVKLLDHFEAVREAMVLKIDDQTQSTAMVAIQGPRVMEMIGHFSKEVPTLKRFRFTTKNVLTMKILISRTGYTGEDGVEVILPAKAVKQAMKMMLDDLDSDDATVKPAGLGARDSLRMEAAMALYGHEITEQIDPVSAGLNFAIKLDKGDDDDDTDGFIGQEVLKKIAADGPARTLTGLILDGRRSARQHMKVKQNEKEIGEITSGCLSPTLGNPIAMAYVESDKRETGSIVQVDLGRTTVDAKIVDLPFYKSP